MIRPFERTLVRNLLDTDEDELILNSFRDYHSEGLDYICLHRSPALTVKAYIIHTPTAANVVNPHNHAYDSTSFVLSGRVQNAVFVKNPSGKLWYRYVYKTPLNRYEGWGFEFDGDNHLLESDATATYGSGEQFQLKRGDIHTIRTFSPEVVMVQFQYKNKAPDGTLLFLREKEIPDTSKLYKTWRKEDFHKSVAFLRDLTEA